MRVLLFLVFLATPVLAQDDGPSGTITVDGTGDAAIERRIEGILAELDGYADIDVTVTEGVVELTGTALGSDAIAELNRLTGRVDGVVAVRNEVTANTDVGDRIDPVLARTFDRFAQAIAYLPLLLIAVVVGLLVASIGWLLARWTRLWNRLAPNTFIAEIYRTIVRLVFTGLGIVVALDILGATAVLGTLLGAAGIVGLAVGFAVRDTVENFIASLMLSLRQPFRPNDFVDIEGNLGTVVRLTSRATILLDPDGNHLRLPNATVFKAKILNYSRNPQRRFGFTLGIDPSDDPAEAKRIGLDVLNGLSFVLTEPPAQAWIDQAGDSTVDMAFYGWIDQTETDFMVARSEAIRMVMAALTDADIGLPEPTYRLNLVGGGLPVVDLPDQANRDSDTDIVVTEGGDEPRTAPRPEPTAPVRSIESLANRERRTTGDDDLLDHSAPVE
ncbi:mechanosensitive ion channel family protein [Jannaschia sp. LMIT008]|uniref:mechanosensitive ion channel family protein n=1 Tax=Jannaschia maritima TaxID=3032585 RepID=UPI002810FFE0|nr:mechanosensitive ion channel family protein [Jannaschia sp. LMIT008]